MRVLLPRRGAHSPFIYLRPSRAIHKASLTGRVTDLSKATVAEAKVAAMNAGTTFHYEAATNSSGVPFAFSQRHPARRSQCAFDIGWKLWRDRLRGEVVSDRTGDDVCVTAR